MNSNCQLSFKQLERVSVHLNLGDRPVDVEILKKGSSHGVEQDQSNNQLVWHISNLIEDGSAVLSFSSEKLAFEDLFPIDIKFDETYSLIDMNVNNVVSMTSGDPLSLKTVHSLSTENYRVTE